MEALLTPEEVASRLKLTPRTIYVWLRKGRLRGVKLGRVWRIKPADLDACVRNAPAAPPAGPEEEEGIDGMELFRKIEAIMSDVPDEEWEKVPRDLGINHDHYLYGAPKRWEG